MFTRKHAQQNRDILRNAKSLLMTQTKDNAITILVENYPEVSKRRIKNKVYKAIRQMRPR